MYLKIKFGPFHSCYLYINSDCCQVCLVRGHWEDRRREVVSPLEENLLQPSLKLAPVSSHQLSKVSVNYISLTQATILTTCPDMVPVSSLASTMSGQAASPGVNCSHLFLHRPTDFHTECCLKVERTFLILIFIFFRLVWSHLLSQWVAWSLYWYLNIQINTVFLTGVCARGAEGQPLHLDCTSGENRNQEWPGELTLFCSL